MVRSVGKDSDLGIASQVGPCLIVEPERATNQVNIFRQALPRVKIYYAFKAFADASIVSAIDGLVDGYDIASLGECDQLEKLGIHTDRMIFANPVKDINDINTSYDKGLRRFVFQSYDEIDKFTEHAIATQAILRIKVPDERNISGQKFSYKYGANPSEAVALIKYASDAGISVVGLTFHVGSQSTDPLLWTDAISICSKIIDDVKIQLDIKLCLLDIGGGFPIDYSDGSLDNFNSIAGAINLALEDIDQSVEIVAEPGRFLVADSAYLVCDVIGLETRDKERWLYVNTGIFHGFMEVFEFQRLLQRVELIEDDLCLSKSTMSKFVLAGQTCDGDDIISREVVLPECTKRGGRLKIMQTGAYFEVYSSSFNSMNYDKIIV